MLRATRVAIALVVGLGALMSCSDTGEDDAGDCAEGSEGCSCYGNGTCDGNLECIESRCQTAGGGGNGGSSGSAMGGNAAGGQPTGGSAGIAAQGGSAGSPQGGASGNPTGGSAGQSGSGAVGGTSGASGAAGTAGQSCGDTSTDWENCGACRRRCDNGGTNCGLIGNDACCVNGQCTPAFGPCFREANGYTTCAQACASIGEACASGACGAGDTWLGWGLNSVDRCESLVTESVSSGGACDATFNWTTSNAIRRCCCTDTQ